MSYCLLIALILVAVFTAEGVKGNTDYTSFQLLANWPSSCEFFLELLLAVEASWIVLSDIVNGTYRNIIASGVKRRRYFFSQTGCAAGMSTFGLLLATLCYCELMKNQAGFSAITYKQWLMYSSHLVLIWVRYMAMVVICASLAFIIKKLYAVVVSVLVLLFFMLFDGMAIAHPELDWVAKIMNYTPHGGGNVLRDQMLKGTLSIGSSILNTLPIGVVAIIAMVIAVGLFEKTDLN